MRSLFHNTLAIAAGVALLAGCSVRDVDDKADTAAAAGSTTAAAPAPAGTTAGALNASTGPVTGTSTGAMAGDSSTMRIEVDLKARQLHVVRGGQHAESHPVAVGSTKWPTETGEWTIKQVVWNPEWTPPDESWADEREPKKPGDPDNPLGRVQLVYDPPRTIHGTNKPESIGKAVSHGSIRMKNEELAALAKEVMEAGGAPKDDAWIQQAQTNRTQKQIVDLPRPIPIRVY
jgi:lipoprotein-anchoring transpeptidase ErfK/SrfK